jgi:subfamily B ATP-binding cassette protein MsbA
MVFLLRTLSFFRQDRWRIALLMMLIGCSVVIGLLMAWPMAILVDIVLSPAPRGDWMHQLLLAPLPDDRLSQIIGLAIIGMLLKLAGETVMLCRNMLNYSLKYRGTSRVRMALFRKLQSLGLVWQRQQPQGDSIYRLSADAFGPFGVLDTVIGTSAAAISLISMTVIMLSRSVPLTVFALSIAPLLFITARVFGRMIRKRSLLSKQADAELTTAMQRGISCMGLIQAFSRQTREAVRFGRAVDDSAGAAMRMHWKENLYPLAVQAIFALGHAIAFGYGGYLIYQSQVKHTAAALTCGDLMVFMAYLGQLWDPLGWVAGFHAKIQVNAAATERVFAILDREAHVDENPDAPKLERNLRAVTFRNVSVH